MSAPANGIGRSDATADLLIPAAIGHQHLSEPPVVKFLRRLYSGPNRRLGTPLVTVVSIVVSMSITGALQSLMGFESRLFWMGMSVSFIVPLLVAPPLTIMFTQLTEHLLSLEGRLHDQAMRDTLTGAPNRRWIMERCELAGSAGSNGSLNADALSDSIGPSQYGLLMIDVDHFKRINDEFGHLAGDFVLIELVSILHRQLRQSDAFGRIGGEEFLVLCSARSPLDLLETGESIRLALSTTSINTGEQEIKMTVSIGGAMLGDVRGPGTLQQTLRRADELLYRAKSRGRNRVEIEAIEEPQTSSFIEV